MRNAFVRAALAAFLMGVVQTSADAAAQDPVAAISEQLQALQQSVAEQQRLLQQQAAEIRELRQQLLNVSGTAATTDEAAKTAANDAKLTSQETPRITMTGSRPTITSADGSNTFAPRAVVQLDAADYREDADAGATDFRRGSVGAGNRETNAARDFSDGAYFRRARFGFEGMIARDFNYRVLLELGGAGTEGPARINDAWISYSGFAPFTIQLGAFSTPANLEDGTSVDGLVFIERSSVSEMSRAFGGADGRIGLGVRGSGKRWMSALTLTSRTVNDAEVFDSQLAAVGRGGFLVATAPDYNIYAGINGTWVFEAADQGSGASVRTPLRFRDRPEIRVDSTRLIDTGSIDANGGYTAGIELGANWKNFYFEAQNFWFGIDRADAALPDPSFSGYYAMASWLITGESRRYDAATGAFQGPRPFVPFTANGGIGAWELALRYSHSDLNYQEGVLGTAALPGAVRGGEQNIWTLGVSWFVNPTVRLMFNYLRIDVDRLNPAGPGNLQPFGPAPATPPLGVPIGQELDVFALRSQFSF